MSNIGNRVKIIALETKLEFIQRYIKSIEKEIQKIEKGDNETSFEHKLENIKTEIEMIENLTT